MILKIKQWWNDDTGIAAVEVAMLLPIILVLLLGIVDLGNAIVIHKKVMTASSVAADLLTRSSSVDDTEMADSWQAAQMAIDPYNRNLLGMDVASIQFQGINATPTVMWRETYNMAANPNVIALAAGLGTEGEGVMVVTTRYQYTPAFGQVLTGTMVMQEVAVTRGRRNSYVSRE
jgi:Flp pilus assembly protein TadG